MTYQDLKGKKVLLPANISASMADCIREHENRICGSQHLSDKDKRTNC
jgi:hypothetical protein